jgi:hypothetical protein
MSEITDIVTRESAGIHHATCPRCETTRPVGVPFCTKCNLRIDLDVPPVGTAAARRQQRPPWRLVLLGLLLALVAVIAILLLG